MSYFRVPATNGVPSTPLSCVECRRIHTTSPTEVYIETYPNAEKHVDWVSITEDEWSKAVLGDTDDLAVAIARKVQELQGASDNAVMTFVSSALGSPHTYLADMKSMTYLTAKYQRVNGNHYDGKPVDWYTKEAGFVPHTGEQISQVFLDGDDFVTRQKATIFARKLAQAESCTSIDQLNWVQWDDKVPPTAPTGLSEALQNNVVHLSWHSNTEPDFSYYNVYEDGVKVNSEPLTSTTYDFIATATGTFNFTVTAVDSDGNESLPSEAVEVNVVTLGVKA